MWPKTGTSGALHGVRAWESTNKSNKQVGLWERRLCCVVNVGGSSEERETRHNTSVLRREGGQYVNRAVPCSARAVRDGFGAEVHVAWQCIGAGERS